MVHVGEARVERVALSEALARGREPEVFRQIHFQRLARRNRQLETPQLAASRHEAHITRRPAHVGYAITYTELAVARAMRFATRGTRLAR